MNDTERAVRVFAADVEDTILGDPAAAQQFQQAWEAIDPRRRPLLVYNSGQSVEAIQWLVLEHRIPVAEFIIGGIGTEMHDPLDAMLAGDFAADIAIDWNGAMVDEIVRGVPAARLQKEEFLNPRKRSWYWPRASMVERAGLEARLLAAGLEVSVRYSSEVFLDVIPRRAGKGNALAWLCRRIGVRLDDVLVAGAGANNTCMFALPGVRGLVVGNATSELFSSTRSFHPLIAREKSASGVLAGLEHFGVLQGVLLERE